MPRIVNDWNAERFKDASEKLLGFFARKAANALVLDVCRHGRVTRPAPPNRMDLLHALRKEPDGSCWARYFYLSKTGRNGKRSKSHSNKLPFLASFVERHGQHSFRKRTLARSWRVDRLPAFVLFGGHGNCFKSI